MANFTATQYSPSATYQSLTTVNTPAPSPQTPPSAESFFSAQSPAEAINYGSIESIPTSGQIYPNPKLG